MRLLSSKFVLLLVSAMLCVGCTVHARYYDPVYHDYHPVSGEAVYYGQWERDTHREHKELKDRNEAEQREYWEWRHHHEDHH